MSKEITKIFSYLELIEPSQVLKNSILKQIATEKRKRLILKLFLDSLAFIIFSAIASFATYGVFASLNSTAFKELASLIWSDGPVMLAYWQDFTYAILDVLPISTIFFLAVGLFWSLWFAHDFINKKTELAKI